MEPIQKQEYHIRDLPTRSITVFPTRAQVVRNIKDVNLKPGINEITILGFTPTVDPHSIKVEGAGFAVISNISVELRENQDIFQEIYPDSDDENSESSDDENEPGHAVFGNSDDDDARWANTGLKETRQEIQVLSDQIKRAAEIVASAESRVKMLDEFGKKVEIKSGSDMSDIMQTYRDQRMQIFEDYMKETIRQRSLKRELDRLQKTERRIIARIDKEKKTASKVLRKEQEAKLKQLDLKNKREQRKTADKERIRQERLSRRSSISSVTDLVKPVIEDQKTPLTDSDAALLACDLSITYVTSDAYWSASYDLQLSTTSNTGTLFFDAQLTNHTSESWKDCKIILSTSQAVFSGLQDTIPKLQPWHIKLEANSSAAPSDITRSTQEAYEQHIWKVTSGAASRTKSGTGLIGISPAAQIGGRYGQKNVRFEDSLSGVPRTIQGDQFGAVARNVSGNYSGSSLFGGLNSTSIAPQPPPVPPSGVLFDAARTTVGGLFGNRQKTATLLKPEPEPEPELSFQESAMEETGLTTTYDLPGTKSLVPSSTASKQRVAHIAFANVAFSHTIVAKYRPGAYLKARMLNESKISLLRGPVGLTLDGAFIGRSTLPRCSSGDKFSMSLGIDPTIKVSYPRPEVKRTVSGVFSKEDSTAYTRYISITNTRGSSSTAGGKAVRLVVLDQVPVSEDEKLRVEVVQPKGLVEDGAGVSTGVQDGTAKSEKDWGRAVASLKKGGEVSWDVELGAGKSVKLGFEYDVSLPTGQLRAVQA